jgi:hypothetical protein
MSIAAPSSAPVGWRNDSNVWSVRASHRLNAPMPRSSMRQACSLALIRIASVNVARAARADFADQRSRRTLRETGPTRKREFIIAIDLDDRDREAQIQLATAIDRDMLLIAAAERLQRADEVFWSTRERCVLARRVL